MKYKKKYIIEKNILKGGNGTNEKYFKELLDGIKINFPDSYEQFYEIILDYKQKKYTNGDVYNINACKIKIKNLFIKIF